MNKPMRYKIQSMGGGYLVQQPGPRQFRKYVHVIVAEKALGRPLPSGAVVHHWDEDKTNNKNTNLVICENQAYHKILHQRMRVIKAGGDPDTQAMCQNCGPKDILQFYKRRNSIQRRCKDCQKQFRGDAAATKRKKEARSKGVPND